MHQMISGFPAPFLFRLILIGFFTLIHISPTIPQTVTEITPLNFGQVFILSNDSQFKHRLNLDGSTLSDPQVLYLNSAQVGEYQITGFPPNTVLGVSLDAPDLSPNGGIGDDFVLNDLTWPNNPTTDNNGDLILIIAGEIKTSGNKNVMTADTYSTIVSLDVSF